MFYFQLHSASLLLVALTHSLLELPLLPQQLTLNVLHFLLLLQEQSGLGVGHVVHVRRILRALVRFVTQLGKESLSLRHLDYDLLLRPKQTKTNKTHTKKEPAPST